MGDDAGSERRADARQQLQLCFRGAIEVEAHAVAHPRRLLFDWPDHRSLIGNGVRVEALLLRAGRRSRSWRRRVRELPTHRDHAQGSDQHRGRERVRVP